MLKEIGEIVRDERSPLPLSVSLSVAVACTVYVPGASPFMLNELEFCVLFEKMSVDPRNRRTRRLEIPELGDGSEMLQLTTLFCPSFWFTAPETLMFGAPVSSSFNVKLRLCVLVRPPVSVADTVSLKTSEESVNRVSGIVKVPVRLLEL